MSKKKRIKKELKKLKKKLRKVVEPAKPVAALQPQPWVTYDMVAASAFRKADKIVNPFDVRRFHRPMPGVVPADRLQVDGPGKGLALDSVTYEVSAWGAASVYNSAFFNGQMFLGYVYLSELAQNPEYRKQAEVIATEVTRKWIEIKSKTNDPSKAERIEQIREFMEDLRVQQHFRKMSEYDSFMGRMHLYLDFGDDIDNPANPELATSIGNGYDGISEEKLKGKKLQRLQAVEPMWVYPSRYNSTNPLNADWYNPSTWFVMGTEVHRTRLLPFVSREVPDLLKAAYQFGGLSLSQMAKPYIDNWLRTRQSVANSVWNYSIPILKTDTMSLAGPSGLSFMQRMELFANTRTNQDVTVLNKDKEDFDLKAAPLGTLDALQSQSQEHQASVSSIPVAKLFGIQPAGLNADSAGMLKIWEDNCSAYQEKFFDPPLKTIFAHCQRSLWGELDPDIVYEWLPMAELTEQEEAEVQKIKMDTRVAGVGAGILDAEEARIEMSNDPESGYGDINPAAVPETPLGAGVEGDVPGLMDGAEETDDSDGVIGQLFPRIKPRREEAEPRREDREDRRDGRREDRREDRKRTFGTVTS